MPIVDIKGVGKVDFPDAWSQDQIVDAIQNQDRKSTRLNSSH